MAGDRPRGLEPAPNSGVNGGMHRTDHPQLYPSRPKGDYNSASVPRSTSLAMPVTLAKPTLDRLADYVAELEQGWSPNTVFPEDGAREELAQIAADPAAFLAGIDDPQALGPPVPQPDGSVIPRLPSFRRWVLADEVLVGGIGIRWQPGTDALPPHVLGHIGFSIIPRFQGRGYARRALELMLDHAWALGLGSVELTAHADNAASQAILVACQGQLQERFTTPVAWGARPAVRYRITRPDHRAAG